MATIANRQQVGMTYWKETTAGQTPTAPEIKNLRTTDPISLNGSREASQSEEIFSHRQTENVRLTKRMVDGSVPFELSYRAYHDWMEALLGGVWTDNVAGTPNTLKVGTNMGTFGIEQQFPDISQFRVSKGITPSGMSLDIGTDGIVTGSFDVMGMDYDEMAATTIGAETDMGTGQPFLGTCDASLKEDDVTIAIVTSLNISVATNKASSGLVGQCSTSKAANGKLEVTGQLTAQLIDAALINKFNQEDESSLEIEFTDVDNAAQKLTFGLPRTKYTGVDFVDIDNNIGLDLSWTALYDSTATTLIQLTDSNPA